MRRVKYVSCEIVDKFFFLRHFLRSFVRTNHHGQDGTARLATLLLLLLHTRIANAKPPRVKLMINPPKSPVL